MFAKVDLSSARNIFQYLGRTFPPYRLASERERSKWKIFRKELDKSERSLMR
ncbi:MAG TPA: hypothetical protein VLD84_06020 [Nitrososphaeraceae archaeon]|nr:hypothetical protein [Nitrososphaeraceae archaeon]